MKHLKSLPLLLLALPVAICKPISGSGLILPRDAPQGLLMWTEEDSFANYTVLPFPDNGNVTDVDNDNDNDNGSSVKAIGPRMNPLPVSKTGCAPLNQISADDKLEAIWRLRMHCDVRSRHHIDIGARSILAMHQGAGVSPQNELLLILL